MGPNMVKFVAWAEAVLLKLHNLVEGLLNAFHTYLKVIISLAWKIGVVLLILDIILKTNFGVLTALLNLVETFAKVSLGGAITIGVVAVIIAIGITVYEKQKKA
jgi:hypothetical protein